MKPKSILLLVIAATCLFISGVMTHAQAAGPATNQVTLVWNAPTNSPVPYVYEVNQTLSLSGTPVWTVVAANIPSTTTNQTLMIDRDFKAWKVRCVNATNTAWVSDFSNVATTLWPSSGGNLSVRLGL